MTPWNFQGVLFDRNSCTITTPVTIGVRALYEVTVEAFAHSNLIDVEFPFQVLDIEDVRGYHTTYYVCHWKVLGEVTSESDDTRKHTLLCVVG